VVVAVVQIDLIQLEQQEDQVVVEQVEIMELQPQELLTLVVAAEVEDKQEDLELVEQAAQE
jgi:hypothetical protein